MMQEAEYVRRERDAVEVALEFAMQCRDILVIGSSLALLSVTPVVGQNSLAVSAPPARTIRFVVLADDVWKDLAHLASRAKRETVRCLIGYVQADTAYVEIAWQPRIYKSSASNVHYGGCPLATLAKWHNHLARFAPTPTQACYLSDTDVADALVQRAPPLQLVQVNETVTCWWSQAQIRAANAGALLGPINRQLAGTPPVTPVINGPLARSP